MAKIEWITKQDTDRLYNIIVACGSCGVSNRVLAQITGDTVGRIDLAIWMMPTTQVKQINYDHDAKKWYHTDYDPAHGNLARV